MPLKVHKLRLLRWWASVCAATNGLDDCEYTCLLQTHFVSQTSLCRCYLSQRAPTAVCTIVGLPVATANCSPCAYCFLPATMSEVSLRPNIWMQEASSQYVTTYNCIHLNHMQQEIIFEDPNKHFQIIATKISCCL
jgi:hypothetical protein